MTRIKRVLYMNSAQIIETFVLLVCIFGPFIFGIADRVLPYIEVNNIGPENVTAYLTILNGDWLIAIFLFFITFLKIREYNKDQIMRCSSAYGNYPYAWYWYCARILGYKYCDLVRIPIYMQYMLVIRATFNEYPLDEADYPCIENEGDSKIEITNISASNKEINIIIEDTYVINDSQIPKDKSECYTIRIQRDQADRKTRHYSEKLIEAVMEAVRDLPDGVTVNLFSTTNALHSKSIAQRVFSLWERGNVVHLYVFQQRKDCDREFEPDGRKVF